MSLLDTASLIVTPNAYKEGKLYSVIPSDGSGDLSVTRATTATRVNSAGLVELVPYNLLSGTNNLNGWGLVNASRITNQNNPFGSNDAIKLTYNTTNGAHYILRSSPSIGQVTISIYAKASELNFLQIASAQTADEYANFNLSTGVVGTKGTSCSSSLIENVGDGWYRCTATLTNGTNTVYFCIANSASMGWFATSTYAGANTTDGLFLYGAQLVEGTQAKDYFATETRLNIPRLDYSLGSCPSLLVEPQRTNLALWSEQFDNAAWTKTNVTVTANNAISPSGVINADTIIGNGVSSSRGLSQTISVTSGATYSMSFYAKKNTNNFVQILFSGVIFSVNSWANFDLNSGVIGSVGSAATASIQSVGNGWYRCTIVATATATNSNLLFINLVTSSTSTRNESNTLTTSVFLWGAQLEAGSYPTSYIPTTSASVTRNADVISKTGISSLIGQTEGTLFVDFIYDHSGTASAEVISISDGTSANRVFLGNVFSSTFSATVTTSSVVQFTSATSYSLVVGQRYKVAIAYKANDFAFYVNGVQISSGTSGSVPPTSRLAFDSGSGSSNFFKPTNVAALWKERLSNAQLAQLTTI
jgi:hypothetical protein